MRVPLFPALLPTSVVPRAPSVAATEPETAPPPSHAPRIPKATWFKLGWAWLVVIAFTVYGGAWLAEPLTPVAAIACFAVLFFTIIAASFGVVHEADLLAHKLGEPYGTLILTLSIVSIEVILIASVLLGPGEFPTIGRDSIFAVMMIIVNLVMGICLVAGGLKYGEQEFNAQGANAYLAMIVLLTGTALVLPNYLSGAGEFTTLQGWTIAAVTAALYAVFLLLQMRNEKRLFIQPHPGLMAVAAQPEKTAAQAKDTASAPGERSAIVRSSLLLLGMIIPIVLLAHHLAIVIDYGVATAGAPVAVSGVLIAIIVFTPESLTAIRAALNNEMQRAINLCLGAFVSTVGLTVPAVLAIGLITGKQVLMGISPLETVLLALTVLLGMLSFNGQRTSVMQGAMHLALFITYGFLLFNP
ncbi:calcium:cation antiporter [Achromobacter marplatensis]|uniref:calcium:proton antiporter n=1 Tax=Achromobacter marplatensis TaxID=470868 RepID=UPI000278040A|nr:calcium:proton antiporter [Achromobacter marplatensis]EJO29158.1 calcium/proton antiporter [Achromobacter marplatensis]